MKRLHLRTWIAGSILFLLVAALARAEDSLQYRKDDKTLNATGKVVEETVSAVKFKPSLGKDLQVPVTDVIRIVYEVPPRVRLEYAAAASLEEKRDYAKALEEYKKLPGQMVTATDQAKRHLDYRIAMLKATLGEPDAIEALTDFLKKHPNSWQYSSVARQLASLQLGKGLTDAAAKTIETWSRIEGLSKELKQQADLLLIDIQFQTGKHADVAQKIKGLLASLPADDPQRPKLEIYQIGTTARDTPIEETVKKLQELIVKTEDRSLKALAYNTLGDCYVMKGLPHEAKFAYLWVDAVFNQDRSEHVKALERLVKLFDTEPLKDEGRAQLFRERAARVR